MTSTRSTAGAPYDVVAARLTTSPSTKIVHAWCTPTPSAVVHSMRRYRSVTAQSRALYTIESSSAPSRVAYVA